MTGRTPECLRTSSACRRYVPTLLQKLVYAVSNPQVSSCVTAVQVQRQPEGKGAESRGAALRYCGFASISSDLQAPSSIWM